MHSAFISYANIKIYGLWNAESDYKLALKQTNTEVSDVWKTAKCLSEKHVQISTFNFYTCFIIVVIMSAGILISLEC
jgi:hypothetical protein